jgi:hypothetical protein
MKSHQEPLETFSYQAKICRFNADVVYRILLLRIAKQYSPQEMSFLMGESLSFMNKIESLKYTSIYLSDIIRMKEVLGGSFGIQCFTSSLAPFAKWEKELHKLTKTIYDDLIIYQMEKCLDNGKAVHIFTLQDSNHSTDYFEHSTEEELASLKRTIETLLHNGYFETPTTPLEIFEKCKSFLFDFIKPKNLYTTLTAFTKIKEYPKLQCKKSKELGYYYIKADKQ